MGTLLAGFGLVALTVFAVGGALLVLERAKSAPEAKQTHKRHQEPFVTHEEMATAIEKVAKDLEWEWTEMYEKFEKLHLRLAKRDARAKAKPEEQLEIEERPVLDIRQYRRL